jgi:hypothetical protein
MPLFTGAGVPLINAWSQQPERPVIHRRPILQPTFFDPVFWDQPDPPGAWNQPAFPVPVRRSQAVPSLSFADPTAAWSLTVAPPPTAWNQQPFSVPLPPSGRTAGPSFADPTFGWFLVAPPIIPSPVRPVVVAPSPFPRRLDLRRDFLVWDDRSTLPIDDDFKVWDPRRMEAVTFTRVRGGQSGDLQNVQAKRRNLTSREKAASNAVYVGAELVWLLPAILIQGVVKPGDLITDGDGAIYTVLDTDLQALRSFWRLRTVNLSIAYDLQDQVDVQRGTVVDDGAGTPVKLFPPDGGQTLYSAVPARVQPTTEEIRDERGIRGPVVKYDVIVSQSATGISTEDRLLWTARGRYLEIRGIRNPEKIDELPVLECELTV